ncbi:MAG TPA: SUMF1/EgtB/PvdO family nonheme iron enzyme [Magnetospirillum sp.]|nr:SUMF1/EgtB/PvdO family nonheme iron enzyme [Magnetospirillum sp.]
MRPRFAAITLTFTIAASAAAQPPVFRDCPECPDMVVLPGCALGRTEVSVGQFQACVDAGACRPHKPRWSMPELPMTDVTVQDVEAYLAWLSARTSHRYRLPTEAEWEAAARAGTDTAYPWGEQMEPGRAVCQHCDPRFDRRPAPVASMAPNPWGLFDMNGNVWEWTADCWDGDCSRRAVRGGSWYFVPRQSRSDSRTPQDVRSWSYDIGFRVLREP